MTLNRFVIEQELPDDPQQPPPTQTSQPWLSSLSSSTPVSLSNNNNISVYSSAIHSAERLTLEACQCPHLMEYLPHVLNLEALPVIHDDESHNDSFLSATSSSSSTKNAVSSSSSTGTGGTGLPSPPTITTTNTTDPWKKNSRNSTIVASTATPPPVTSSSSSSTGGGASVITEYQLTNPIHALHVQSHHQMSQKLRRMRINNPHHYHHGSISEMVIEGPPPPPQLYHYYAHCYQQLYQQQQQQQPSSSSLPSTNTTTTAIIPSPPPPPPPSMLISGPGVCLYDDEQLRTRALCTDGISESWCSTLYAIRPPPLSSTLMLFDKNNNNDDDEKEEEEVVHRRTNERNLVSLSPDPIPTKQDVVDGGIKDKQDESTELTDSTQADTTTVMMKTMTTTSPDRMEVIPPTISSSDVPSTNPIDLVKTASSNGVDQDDAAVVTSSDHDAIPDVPMSDATGLTDTTKTTTPQNSSAPLPPSNMQNDATTNHPEESQQDTTSTTNTTKPKLEFINNDYNHDHDQNNLTKDDTSNTTSPNIVQDATVTTKSSGTAATTPVTVTTQESTTATMVTATDETITEKRDSHQNQGFLSEERYGTLLRQENQFLLLRHKLAATFHRKNKSSSAASATANNSSASASSSTSHLVSSSSGTPRATNTLSNATSHHHSGSGFSTPSLLSSLTPTTTQLYHPYPLPSPPNIATTIVGKRGGSGSGSSAMTTTTSTSTSSKRRKLNETPLSSSVSMTTASLSMSLHKSSSASESIEVEKMGSTTKTNTNIKNDTSRNNMLSSSSSPPPTTTTLSAGGSDKNHHNQETATMIQATMTRREVTNSSSNQTTNSSSLVDSSGVATAASSTGIPVLEAGPLLLTYKIQGRLEALANQAKHTVSLWMDHFRRNRRRYWQQQQQQQQQHSSFANKTAQQHHKPPLNKKVMVTHPSFHANNNLSMDFFAAAVAKANRTNQRPSKLLHYDKSFSGNFNLRDKDQRAAGLSNRTSHNLSSSSSRLIILDDQWMQCLTCSFVGLAPYCMLVSSSSSSSSLWHPAIHSVNPQHQYIWQHMMASGHKLAVSCGIRADLFCFDCGDVVYHPLFDQERERLDLAYSTNMCLPWMAWKEHPVQRSFDAFSFVRTEEHGLVWRGLIATYPILVPSEHVVAARHSLQRRALFQGRLDYPYLFGAPPSSSLSSTSLLVSSSTGSNRAIEFGTFQQLHGLSHEMITAPVGMYNLGNTCFQSAILQCLVHCQPFQHYFLKQVGHDHRSCRVYQRASASSSSPSPNPVSSGKGQGTEVCLACEMDILFLQYLGRTMGKNILAALSVAEGFESTLDSEYRKAKAEDGNYSYKGEPLITADMLTVAWKSGGMDHLVGYEQRDAHEYLHAFLEILGKHVKQFRDRVFVSLNRAGSYAFEKQDKVSHDIVKKVFEGTLRSVLICEECGNKRSMTESFLSVSLPLSKEVERRESGSGKRGSHAKAALSVESCLENFTAPERLSDPVDCPSCKKKTLTKKQHTFSKLPKILCLHLKRFDAAQNKKIDDFVSFPARNLNLGVYLPHWCEATQSVSDAKSSRRSEAGVADMQILYDLFSTVNHHGNLQSGHYVTNVKVKDQWYHCNDAHISRAGQGTGEKSEKSVLTSEGAYLLFYTRRR